MTTVVLPLSAGSIMMSVSLFRSWKASRSCLVMFRRNLALERIPVCGYYLLVLMEIDRWFIISIWLIISSFGIFLGAIAKLGPLASVNIVSWDRSLLDRFLTLNREDCGTRFIYFCFCLLEDCVWLFIACSYVIRSRICQISCCMVNSE